MSAQRQRERKKVTQYIPELQLWHVVWLEETSCRAATEATYSPCCDKPAHTVWLCVCMWPICVGWTVSNSYWLRVNHLELEVPKLTDDIVIDVKQVDLSAVLGEWGLRSASHTGTQVILSCAFETCRSEMCHISSSWSIFCVPIIYCVSKALDWWSTNSTSSIGTTP